MKDFQISSSFDQNSWNLLLEHTLADPRIYDCDIPLVTLDISGTDAIGKYMELKLLSFYRATFALRFFAVDYIEVDYNL